MPYSDHILDPLIQPPFLNVTTTVLTITRLDKKVCIQTLKLV